MSAIVVKGAHPAFPWKWICEPCGIDPTFTDVYAASCIQRNQARRGAAEHNRKWHHSTEKEATK